MLNYVKIYINMLFFICAPDSVFKVQTNLNIIVILHHYGNISQNKQGGISHPIYLICLWCIFTENAH